MNFLRLLVAVIALLWTVALPFGQAHARDGEGAPEPILLATPDGSQKVRLSFEPCALPEAQDAPVKLLHADIEIAGKQYSGCWILSQDGRLGIFTPKDAPDLSDDLAPVDKPSMRKGKYT